MSFRRMLKIIKTLLLTKNKINLLENTIRVYKRDGFFSMLNRIKQYFAISGSSINLNNSENLAVDIFNNQQKEISKDQMILEIEKFSTQPLISIIMPVYNTPSKWLERAIDSLRKQVYKNWELCAVDDFSKNNETRNVLKKYAEMDDRIKFHFSERNGGISKSSNIALQMAKGSFIGLLDHDDELTPDALFWVVKEINKNKDVDFIYSDECKIDDTEKRRLFHFIFKPDWSPEMLLNGMYTGHLTVYRKELVQNIGGFRSEYDFSQDYDLALRISERTTKILHVERVLYLWRAIDGSAAKGGKDFARITNLNALNDAARRRKLNARILRKSFANYLNLTSVNKDKVSIIIPTDSYENLTRSLESILLNTAYDNYEIVIVCNSDVLKEINKEYLYANNIVYSNYDKSFNFSDKCNQGAEDSSGDILVFFNDDVVPLESSWIEKLIEYLYLPGVGGVSPKLIFEDGRIQYAGMIVGTPGIVGTAYNGYFKDENDSFLSMHKYVRDISILSGACCAIKKKTFFEIGGYNFVNTPNGHSDVDLSFKILEKGLRCVYTPNAVLIHIGNHTWHPKKHQKDKSDIFLLKRWGKYLEKDPYFTDSMKAVLYRDFSYKFKIFSKNVLNKEYNGKDILLVSHELSLTGAPRALFVAAKALKEAGNFPVIIAPKDGPMRMEFEKEGITTIIDEMIFQSHWLTERFVKNFDLILVNTSDGYPIINQMASYNIPIVWWLHEAKSLKNFKEKNDKIKAAFDRCNKIILVSEYARRFVDVYSDKSVILQNGIDDVLFSDNNEEHKKIKFCTIGTIESRKGQDILVEAILLLPYEVLKKAEFYIIGEVWPENKSFYNNLLAKSVAISQIKYLKTVSHEKVLKIINSCNVLICPSRDEPSSLVTIEALMCKKAVIINNNVGVGGKLKNEQSCLNFKSNDARDLSDKIRLLIEKPKIIINLGTEGRKVYEKEFTVDKFKKTFIDIVESIYKK